MSNENDVMQQKINRRLAMMTNAVLFGDVATRPHRHTIPAIIDGKVYSYDCPFASPEQPCPLVLAGRA